MYSRQASNQSAAIASIFKHGLSLMFIAQGSIVLYSNP
jgi:hypothetical protein